MMNTEKIKSEWTEIKDTIKNRWGKFNDSEIDGLNGHMEQLSEKLQRIYGFGKGQAQRESALFTASLQTAPAVPEKTDAGKRPDVSFGPAEVNAVKRAV